MERIWSATKFNLANENIQMMMMMMMIIIIIQATITFCS